MSKNIFIIGTGTDIGKTYITGLILKKLRENNLNAGYFKSAMSGNIRDEEGNLLPLDAIFIKNIAKTEGDLDEYCPYIYEKPYSPDLAARIEGNPLKMDYLMKKFKKISNKYDYLAIEGSGGIICPISSEIYLVDIIKKMNSKIILIADAGLGTINSIGLTIHYIESMNIPIKGIILNNYENNNILHEYNLNIVEKLTGIKIIGKVKRDEQNLDMDLEELKSLFE